MSSDDVRIFQQIHSQTVEEEGEAKNSSSSSSTTTTATAANNNKHKTQSEKGYMEVFILTKLRRTNPPTKWMFDCRVNSGEYQPTHPIK